MKTSLRQLLIAVFTASVVALSGPTAAVANENLPPAPAQETETITAATAPMVAAIRLPLSEASTPEAEGQAPGLSRLVRISPDVVKPGEDIIFEWETAGDAPIAEIQVHLVNDSNSREPFFTIYPGGEATFRVTPDQLSPGDHILTQVVVVGQDGTETSYSRSGSVSSTKPPTLTPPPPLSDLSQLDFRVLYWTAAVDPVVIEDRPGSAEDAFVIPSSPHVDYMFREEGESEEEVLAPGRYPRQGDKTHYFRAQTHSGYLPGGPRTGWDHRFSDAHPPYEVTPLPVTFVDFFDNGRGIYIIPTTPGVEYWVGGSVKTSGVHSAQGSVTVTAKPMSDYVITNGATFTWTKTFTANELVPTPPTFLDKDGTAEDTYTIPATPNVEYLVNGSVRSAGTYPTAGTVTVTGLITVIARAKQGYSLAEGTTATWQKTFSATSAEYVPPAKSPFTDVSTKQQFYREMAWLSNQGISTGWDNGNGTRSYKPLAPINRDAMAAFLYRAEHV
ncbi:S-layer homology domain-containing protein [Arthrobacter sp. H20]|uniref:S-layer homology domain-containing protein n=1 Tax=Arthrobacter sp. H20 TaxID=1267981 RepID=UPI00047C6317|nr:S-layer homology domain-containing protein [Arthrobacter sp. H20]